MDDMRRLACCVTCFVVAIIAHLTVVQGYACFFMKRPDPSRGGELRWSLLRSILCGCQRIYAPKYVLPCQGNYEEGDLFFLDDLYQLTLRSNWQKEILDDLLQRTEYCDFNECHDSAYNNCHNKTECTNTIGSFNCTCNGGYYGDGVSCEVCSDYIGVENGDIPDANMQASSDIGNWYEPYRGRLNNYFYWEAPEDDNTPWIQVDIGNLTFVSGVITQGNGESVESIHAHWVASYTVSTFVSNGSAEIFAMNGTGVKIFPGNVDGTSLKISYLPEPVYAQIVRITCVETGVQYGYFSMRFEIMGCKTNYMPNIKRKN